MIVSSFHAHGTRGRRLPDEATEFASRPRQRTLFRKPRSYEFAMPGVKLKSAISRGSKALVNQKNVERGTD
jgi:hypothetical protein